MLSLPWSAVLFTFLLTGCFISLVHLHDGTGVKPFPRESKYPFEFGFMILFGVAAFFQGKYVDSQNPAINNLAIFAAFGLTAIFVVGKILIVSLIHWILSRHQTADN